MPRKGPVTKKRRTAGSGVWLQIINQIHQQNHA